MGDVPYGDGACFDFALFINVGRAVVTIAWAVAAVGVIPGYGKEYCIYRTFAALLPGIFYFASLFTMNDYLAMPILWTIAIGLDIILHVVPSTIVWPWPYVPRHTHFSEERHAMLYIVSLGECVIAAGVPARVGLPLGRTVSERYGAMLGITIMAYFLCIQNFIASDSAKLEHNGGTHALHVSRFARIVWMTTQFLSVTAMVIAGAIVKNATKYLTMAPLTGSMFFRYWFGFSICLIVLVTALCQLVHIYPSGDQRTFSRTVRFFIRVTCAVFIFAFTFIPISVLGEPGWILVIGLTLIPFTLLEWIGRNRKGRSKGIGRHGSAKDHDTHSVPLLDDDLSNP